MPDLWHRLQPAQPDGRDVGYIRPPRRSAPELSLIVRKLQAAPPRRRCPPQHLRLLALDRRGDLRRLVAAHPGCPPDALAVLSADDDTVTVYAALTNPGCPPALLRRAVAAHDNAGIWRAALTNPACPPELFDAATTRFRSGDDHDTRMRHAAASNPGCPQPILLQLTADLSPFVRSAAAANIRDHATVAALTQDSINTVRQGALSNANCPTEKLASAARDGDSWERLVAVSHPGCPAALVGRSASSTHPGLRRAAATNPSCPPETLRLLIEDPDTAVRASATANPSCAPDVIAHAASTDPDLAHVAIKNPRCPTATLVRLSVSEDIAAAETALQTLSRRNVQSPLTS